MNIHEYQAKGLLAKFGVSVPRGAVAYTPDEASKAAKELGGDIWVVKSQIHAGGRGAGHFAENPDGGGGVRLARSDDEVRAHAEAMLGQTLVTKQTGPDGKEVKRIYVEEGCDIARELYLSLLVDRETSRIVIVASTEGGMDIEEVAENTPELIFSEIIDPRYGLHGFQARRLAGKLGLKGKSLKAGAALLANVARCFSETDAAMVEINPMVVTNQMVDEYGRIVLGEFKTGDDFKAGKELMKSGELDLSLLDAEIEALCAKLLETFPECMTKSLEELRKPKLNAWNANKENSRAWLALNMMNEARTGFRAFNEGTKETGREIDFVKLRQGLAQGVPWTPELIDSLMPGAGSDD